MATNRGICALHRTSPAASCTSRRGVPTRSRWASCGKSISVRGSRRRGWVQVEPFNSFKCGCAGTAGTRLGPAAQPQQTVIGSKLGGINHASHAQSLLEKDNPASCVYACYDMPGMYISVIPRRGSHRSGALGRHGNEDKGCTRGREKGGRRGLGKIFL